MGRKQAKLTTIRQSGFFRYVFIQGVFNLGITFISVWLLIDFITDYIFTGVVPSYSTGHYVKTFVLAIGFGAVVGLVQWYIKKG